MRTYAKITPEGTKDYLYEECAARQAVQQALTKVFKSCGFAPIATPHLEFHDVFRRASADSLSGLFYSVTDSRGRLLVMRPDSTLPLARVAATRLQNAALPLRLYYHQSVFRRAKPDSGHSDELMQSGVELLGAGGLRADLELLSCAVEALEHAPFFRIELGHAAIFSCLADELLEGEQEETLRDGLIHAIETKNVPQLQALLAPFGQSHAAQVLLELPRLFGGGSVLTKARALFRHPGAIRALDSLAALYEACRALGLHDYIDIDLGLVHGQQYYTGLVFRGYIASSGRQVLSGGRYDNLLAEFGRPAPAAGFALELDPLAEALLESGAIQAPPPANILVFGAPGCEAAALRRCRELRRQGVACEYAVCETYEEAQVYAAARGIANVELII